MAGTKAGAAKTKETNLKKYGSDFYASIGAKGGRAKNPKKGFGADPERARIAGAKGGRNGHRGKGKPRTKLVLIKKGLLHTVYMNVDTGEKIKVKNTRR